MAVVGDVFGLNAVYDRQVENVTNNNFASWPEGGNYGYFVGGYRPSPSGASATIDRIDFSTNTTSAPGNNLPQVRNSHVSVLNASYGYFGGGWTPVTNPEPKVDRIDFTNETTSTPGNNLPSARTGLAAVSGSAYGYFGGGSAGGQSSIIDRIDFSNETTSRLGNDLSQARWLLEAVSSSSHGYFAGGSPTAPTGRFSVIDRIDFSSETISSPGNLPAEKNVFDTVSSPAYGYFCGGSDGTNPPTSTIDRIEFSSETISSSGNLPLINFGYRSNSGRTSSISHGYFAGGTYGNAISTIDRMDFSNEIISTLSNNLTETRTGAAGVSGGASIIRGNGYRTYGYYGGGYQPGAVFESRIERIDFSTQTDSVMASKLIYQHVQCNTVSSNNHGYFVGGFIPSPGGFPYQSSRVQRFDFTSEILSELPSQSRAPYEVSSAGTLSNSQYGFVAGGLKGVPNGSVAVSTTIRLDFSSDSLSQPSSDLTQARTVLNGVSDLRNNLGYFGGGYSNCRVCRIDLSSETITQNPSPLDRDMSYARTYQSGDYGYWAGGKYTPNQPPPGGRAWSSTRKIQFSTGTTQVGSPMNTGRYAGGVSQDNYYAWYAAGMAPSFTYTSNVQRVELSTGTYSNPGNPLSFNRSSNPGGLSN